MGVGRGKARGWGVSSWIFIHDTANVLNKHSFVKTSQLSPRFFSHENCLKFSKTVGIWRKFVFSKKRSSLFTRGSLFVLYKCLH